MMRVERGVRRVTTWVGARMIAVGCRAPSRHPDGGRGKLLRPVHSAAYTGLSPRVRGNLASINYFTKAAVKVVAESIGASLEDVLWRIRLMEMQALECWEAAT